MLTTPGRRLDRLTESLETTEVKRLGLPRTRKPPGTKRRHPSVEPQRHTTQNHKSGREHIIGRLANEQIPPGYIQIAVEPPQPLTLIMVPSAKQISYTNDSGLGTSLETSKYLLLLPLQAGLPRLVSFTCPPLLAFSWL